MGTNLFLSNPLLKEHQHTTMEESGNNNDYLTKNLYPKIVFYMCKKPGPMWNKAPIISFFIGKKFKTFMQHSISKKSKMICYSWSHTATSYTFSILSKTSWTTEFEEFKWGRTLIRSTDNIIKTDRWSKN